jgi:hypothetical protein
MKHLSPDCYHFAIWVPGAKVIIIELESVFYTLTSLLL